MTADLTECKQLEDALNVAIAAKKDAEQRAQYSEARYRALIEQAANALFIHDLDGNFVEINQQACDNLGYSQQELLQMNLSDIVPGFDLAEKRLLWNRLQPGKPCSIISTHRRKDGSTFPVEVRFASLEIDNNRQVMGLVSDISERHQAEDEQRITVAALKDAQRRAQHSELRYRTLIESAAEALFVFDLDANFVEVNQRACDSLDYSREELLGMNIVDVSPGYDTASRRPVWQQLEPGKPYSMTATHRRKDGSTFPIEIHLTALVIDDQKLMMALVNDISARKLAEKNLADSLAFNRVVLESSPCGIAVFKADGRCVMANDTYARLIGATTEEVLQQNFRNNASWQRNGLLDCANEALATEKTVRRDKKGVTSFGKKVALECLFTPVNIGESQHLLVIVNDVLDRLSAEHALHESMRLLEEKELSKTRFLAAAGHDLRQPVAAASLFVDALKLTELTRQQNSMIDKLDQSMKIFSGMLERLLDISKFDAGLIKPQLVTFHLAELINWLELNFTQMAADKNLQFRVFRSKGWTMHIHSDIGLLQSVLMNLVTNAIKFTSRGGILIGIRPRGDKVLLQVWDTGIGISESELAHIFDEFYQVANPQRNRAAGLGLGLSICQRAISLLGSKVACRSRPGHGSVFELSLPLNTAREQIEQHPADISSPEDLNEMPFKGRNVVVLEDDILVATGMVNLLQGLGAEVLHFYSAEEALRHSGISTADYFIVDYALSGEINGHEFLKQVQQRQQTPVRAVIITGETSSKFISGMTNSPWPLLHKPVNSVRLAASLSHDTASATSPAPPAPCH